MKIPTLIQAALIAISLAGGAHAAAHAAPAAPAASTSTAAAHTTVVTAAHDASLLPAGYAANPANGAFAAADDSEEVQPDPHAKNSAQVDAAAAPVPEPQMFLMMLIGLVLLGLASSRRETFEKFTD